jgi:hypothetical protein
MVADAELMGRCDDDPDERRQALRLARKASELSPRLNLRQ